MLRAAEQGGRAHVEPNKTKSRVGARRPEETRTPQKLNLMGFIKGENLLDTQNWAYSQLKAELSQCQTNTRPGADARRPEGTRPQPDAFSKQVSLIATC